MNSPPDNADTITIPGTGGSLDLRSVPDEQTLVRTLNTIRKMHVLERIAGRFEKESLPLMALKGAALHLTLFDRPDVRPMNDIDLMVRPQDLERALDLFAAMGCERVEDQVTEGFFPRFYHEVPLVFGDVLPVRIDLHVRPLRPLRYASRLPDDAFWEGASPVQVGRATILIPSSEDMLIHLAAHSAVHGNSRRLWLEDILAWAKARSGMLDWERFLARVRGWGLALPVRRALERVESDIGDCIPGSVREALAAERVGWLDRLALWHAPRDAAHPVGHVAVNMACVSGWRSRFSYLGAVMWPDASHMESWYPRRHRGWRTVARLWRWISPLLPDRALREPGRSGSCGKNKIEVA